MDTFIVNVFMELKLYWDSYFCFGLGYEIQNVNFQIQMAQKFKNCYKTFIKKFCDWSNWVGQTALYLDECEDSNSVLTKLFSINPQQY